LHGNLGEIFDGDSAVRSNVDRFVAVGIDEKEDCFNTIIDVEEAPLLCSIPPDLDLALPTWIHAHSKGFSEERSRHLFLPINPCTMRPKDIMEASDTYLHLRGKLRQKQLGGQLFETI